MAVHKVFLVEDEVVAREGIRDTIAWQELGFTFCGEAPDGEVALPLIREIRPDVLITDIKMPFMDGLQLCKLVREQLPEIKIIILSGYDDFSYAQQAIKLGVTEYLLKPVSAKDLRAVLERVAAQLDEEHTSQALLHRMIAQLEDSRALRRNKFLLDLMLGQTSTAEALAEAQGLGVELSAPCYLVLFIEQTGEEIWEEVTYNGYLGSADSGSASSFGSGGGWSEIMTFECVEPDLDDYNIPDPEDVTFQ